MKPTRYFAVVAFTIAILLLGTRLIGAQPRLEQAHGAGGGMIRGSVYGFNTYNQLEPVVWACVYANDGNYTFFAYTDRAGYYEMYAPQGTYNVTVVQSGYSSSSSTVVVAPGSVSTINFYMKQSHVPIPEFPSAMVSVLTLLATAAVLIATRRSKRVK